MKSPLLFSALASIALSLFTGCGARTPLIDDYEDAPVYEDLDDGVIAQQKRPEFGDGSACHVPTERISGGTRDGLWCCGTKTCNDAETCGDHLGQTVEACAVCNYYECIPGEGAAPGNEPDHWRDVFTPPTGGVLVDP